MSNIIVFPNKLNIDQNELERSMKQVLVDHGFSNETIERVIPNALLTLDESKIAISKQIKIPSSISLSRDQLDELSVEFQKYQKGIANFILALVVQKMILEAQKLEDI